MCDPRHRANTNVLRYEVLSCEVIEHVTILNSLILILLLLNKFVKFIADDSVHTLEDFGDVETSSHVLLVYHLGVVNKGSEFPNHTLGPTAHLVVHNVDFLELFLEKEVVLVQVTNGVVKFHDFFVHHVGSGRCALVTGIGVNLQIMESGSQFLIVFLEFVNFPLTFGYGHQQLTVCLLTGQELSDHLLHISNTSCCLDCLEGLINGLRLSHFLFHLLSHEGVPELLNVEVLSHLQLGGVLVLICSGLCNFLVPSLSFNSSLDRFLLVLNAPL